MPTTITKTIGTGGDYSTIQAWEDACPTDLTSVDQIWKGLLKKQEFVSTTGSILTLAGTTCDLTRYLWLSTDTGASFIDDANAPNNPLRYDASKGAGLRVSAVYVGSVISMGGAIFKMDKVQVRGDASGIQAGTPCMTQSNSADRTFLSRCIFESDSRSAGQVAQYGTESYMESCLVIRRRADANTGGYIVAGSAGVDYYNNTFVSIGAAVDNAILSNYGATQNIKNCAIFNATAVYLGSGTPTYTNCYTDIASPPTGFTTTAFSTSSGAKFRDISVGTHDFRVKSGSSLINSGATDSTYALTDILGVSRSGTWDVGAIEYTGPTITKKTIGTSRDYSTVQAWEDATPSDITASDEIWQGLLANQNHTAAGGGTVVDVGGTATDGTRYIHLTCETGASFTENANVRTNALRYDTSYGASISAVNNYGTSAPIKVGGVAFKISGVMVKTTGFNANCVTAISTSGAFQADKCIFEQTSAAQVLILFAGTGGFATQLSNCLIAFTGSGAMGRFVDLSDGSHMFNCTLASVGGGTVSNGFATSYGPSTVKNCAIFGVSTALDTGAGGAVYTTCATDLASPPTGVTQMAFSTSSGAKFTNITAGTHDLRIQSGSGLIDAGTTDTTNAPLDITGMTRSGAWDIGAWEIAAVTVYNPVADVTVTGWIPVGDTSVAGTMDETSYSDTDYSYSPNISASPGPAIMTLSGSLAPGTWDVSIRARQTNSVGQIRVSLLDDSNTVLGTSSWQTPTASFATYILSVTTSGGTATRIKLEVQ